MKSTKASVIFLALTAMLLGLMAPASAVSETADRGEAYDSSNAADEAGQCDPEAGARKWDASGNQYDGTVAFGSDVLDVRVDDKKITFSGERLESVTFCVKFANGNSDEQTGLTFSADQGISNFVIYSVKFEKEIPGNGDEPFDGVGVAGAFICKAQADGDFELYRGGDQDPQFETQKLEQGDYVWRFTNPNDVEVSFTAGTDGVGYFGETTIEAGEVIFLTSTSSIGGLDTLTEGEVLRGRHSTNENPCDVPETSPTLTLTIDKVWTGDGSGDASFEVIARAPFTDGTAGNDRIELAAEAEPGDEITVPDDALGIEITESVDNIPAGCTSSLVDVSDNQGAGSAQTDGLGDYGIPVRNVKGESITVTFTNDLECESTPSPVPTVEVEASAVEVDADISAECVADDERAVTYVLDNSASEDAVVFSVEIGDETTDVEVAPGDAVSATEIITSDDGAVRFEISVDDERLARATLTANQCVAATEVLDDVEETETETDTETETESEAAPTPPTQVLGVAAEVASDQARLPDTGASALMLALLGLLSVGFGGALVRPRKRG